MLFPQVCFETAQAAEYELIDRTARIGAGKTLLRLGPTIRRASRSHCRDPIAGNPMGISIAVTAALSLKSTRASSGKTFATGGPPFRSSDMDNHPPIHASTPRTVFIPLSATNLTASDRATSFKSRSCFGPPALYFEGKFKSSGPRNAPYSSESIEIYSQGSAGSKDESLYFCSKYSLIGISCSKMRYPSIIMLPGSSFAL
jgi:hypothetical protein